MIPLKILREGGLRESAGRSWGLGTYGALASPQLGVAPESVFRVLLRARG